MKGLGVRFPPVAPKPLIGGFLFYKIESCVRMLDIRGLIMSRAVYYIAKNKDWGHVCSIVWEILDSEGYLSNKMDMEFSGGDVYKYVDNEENEYFLVETDKAICLDYERYLPYMNKYFSDADISGMVTWHEGASSLPNVITCHTLGDMNSGVFTKAKPRYMRNIMKGMERLRLKEGLLDYKVVTEGTHWSGVHGEWNGSASEEYGDPYLLNKYSVAMMDLEVGSDENSWNDYKAVKVLTKALFEIFNDDNREIYNILCVGGVHFEPSFTDAVFAEWEDKAFGISHILANQWLVTGEYDTEEGFEKAVKCADSIEGGIQAVFMHDKAKGCYKDLARRIGQKYGVNVYKHKKLRDPKMVEFN